MNKRWRYLALPALIAALHGAVYLLPKTGTAAESAVNLELPLHLGDWTLRESPPTLEEVSTLAKDTQFAKAICLAPRIGEYGPDGQRIADRIDLSIVLSGHDLTSSIHRPERCMPAQGHDIFASGIVPIELPNGRKFSVRKLLSRQNIPLNKEKTKTLQLQAVTYYFFVGHHHVTHDHTMRTLIDMQDRILHGTDQRWAYISVTTWYGKLPWMEEAITQQEAETKIRQFLAKLTETNVNWKMIAP